MKYYPFEPRKAFGLAHAFRRDQILSSVFQVLRRTIARVKEETLDPWLVELAGVPGESKDNAPRRAADCAQALLLQHIIINSVA